MLERKYGGRYQNGYLLVIGHSLEGGTYGHLCLAESHIAAHQAVHGAAALHILLDIKGSLELIGRILIHETGLQLILHISIRAVCKALLLQSLGVQFDKVTRYILDLAFGALLEVLPGTRTQFVYVRFLTLLALVLGNLVQGVDGDKHHIIILIDNLDFFLISARLRHTHQTAELTYSVINMHHVITNLELLQFLDRKRHLTVTGTLAAQIVLVKSVKYLMVCKEAAFKQSVSIPLMQCLADGLKRDVLTALGKDGLQTLPLLGVICQYINTVALYNVIRKGL